MKRYKQNFKQVIKEDEEEAKSEKAIKDLIDLNWGKDEEAQNTAIALFKALVFANTKVADKFIQDLSDFTSKMNSEDYKESTVSKKKDKKIKESMININNVASAQYAVVEAINYLTNKFGIEDSKVIKAIGFAINSAFTQIPSENDTENIKFSVISRLCRDLKARI